MVEKLEKEYDLDVQWLGLEIHPETPATGVNLSEKFSRSNLDNMLNGLNHSGSLYGINFGKLERMPNSHNALEAAEFAKAHGKSKEYHSSLMDEYFRDLKDIGNLEVLGDLGKNLGLNKEELINAVKNRAYETTLNNSNKDAHSMGINSTPTFVINDKYSIVGAQPIEAFRTILDKIK
ncbi:DsbA family protein [Clostridium sp. CF012]|nr:DsbA family protein [Clostridium sp. CF012]